MKKKLLVIAMVCALCVSAVFAAGCSNGSGSSSDSSDAPKYVMLEPALSSEHYAVGFKQGETDLANQVTQTLYDMYQDGTVAQLCEKYSEYGVNIENWVLNEPVSTSSSQADIDTLIVGFDAGYPPYGFVGTDGEYTGLDLDLAAEVAKRNNWDLQLEAIDWDAKDVLLNQGTINCIWNGFTMEGRENDYTFTEPYMLNEQVVVVKADSGIQGIEDLEGKIVATQVDSAALDVLEGDMKDVAATFKELQQLSDYNNAFMQLDAGAVDAVVCDLSIAQYQLAAN